MSKTLASLSTVSMLELLSAQHMEVPGGQCTQQVDGSFTHPHLTLCTLPYCCLPEFVIKSFGINEHPTQGSWRKQTTQTKPRGVATMAPREGLEKGGLEEARPKDDVQLVFFKSVPIFGYLLT